MYTARVGRDSESSIERCLLAVYLERFINFCLKPMLRIVVLSVVHVAFIQKGKEINFARIDSFQIKFKAEIIRNIKKMIVIIKRSDSTRVYVFNCGKAPG